MAEWPVIYLGWLLFAIAGFLAGYRLCWYHWQRQRMQLIARWRRERRKHRQKRPWVKAWCLRHGIGLAKLAKQNFVAWSANHFDKLASETLSERQNTIPNQQQQGHAGADRGSQ